MHAFWEIIASNALVATVLAIGTVLLSRVWKNPAAIHLLWVVVLLKLFTPPILIAELPFAADWLLTTADANLPGERPPSFALDASQQDSLTSASNPDGTNRRNRADGNGRPDPQQSAWTAAIGYRAWSLSNLLVGIWACGSVCVSLGYAFRIRRFSRLLDNTESPPEIIATMARQLGDRLGLSRSPSVLMTPSTLPPLVWSIGGRPRVVLPSELFTRLSGEAQTAILAHELAHIRRRDYLIRLLELTATTLFWWHPVVWWACSQLRELEEQCCDSRVLELVPHQARIYAAALVDTLEFLSEHPRVVVPLPTAVYSSGSLSRRIRMLTQRRTNRLNSRSAILVAAIVAVPLAVVFAEAPQQTDSPVQQAVPILKGRVTNDAGAPLSDVRVRIAIPATDMRFVDSSSNHKQLETETDAAGAYKLELSGIKKATTISIDAMKPGYRRLAGTLRSGGDQKDVEVAPGVAAEASLVLKPALYCKGIVVDEKGKPVPAVKISANAQFAHSSGGVERTASNSDGSFEIFNYSLQPLSEDGDASKGVVHFFHPDYVGSQVDDIYALSTVQREALRIVLPTGYQVSGTLLDVAEKPVPGVMVKTTRENGRDRKATITDANGKFVLRGLVAGPTTLRAHALDLKQKVKLPVALDSDKQNLEVRLQAISLPERPPTVAVLGMQLTDITPELQSAYDLYDERGALILDPGKDSERLGIGKLAEGYSFWMVGQRRIGSVREFVEQILAEAAAHEADDYSVRVVYNFSTLDMDGSNTQYLKLTKNDLDQLRTALAKLAHE